LTPFSKTTEVSGYSPVFDCVAKRYGLMTAAVFGVIWRHCQMYRGVCDASQTTLADKLHTTRETINRELKKLCDAKLIKDLTPNAIGVPHTYQDISDIVIRIKEEVVTRNHTDEPVTNNHTPTTKPVIRNHKTCDEKSHKDTIKKQKEKKQPAPSSGDSLILEYTMTDDTDSIIDCDCGHTIVIAKLADSSAECPNCMKPVRVTNWLDTVVKKPSQKARRQESGFTDNLDSFDDKPFKAFCIVYGVPYDGMPVKKVRQWAYKIKEVADTYDVDAEIAYQAIKAIKESEHAWKTYTSPYSKQFQELLGVMIARVKKGENQENDKPVGYYDNGWSLDD
jgi:hypothetical protein